MEAALLQAAERALEEIRRDCAFDYDADFEYITEDDTNGFNENDGPVYKQQQQRRPRRPRRPWGPWGPRRPRNLE